MVCDEYFSIFYYFRPCDEFSESLSVIVLSWKAQVSGSGCLRKVSEKLMGDKGRVRTGSVK